MLESGVVLSERYRLEERVATGGMGDVWRGTDLVLNRRVAVKVLLPALLADPGFIARFRAEARMMAALHNPGVVQVYDSGEDTLPGGARADYLVMEYVDGEPLSHRLSTVGRLDAAETMSIVAQAAQALDAAHAAGIVHRDVKPSNLLVHPDGTVVLVDFGVARSTTVTSITGTNAVPGTALYMAPEQALGKKVSPATDIYALGTVAYHCLAGHTPFSGDNPLEVAIKHTQDEPPPLPDDVPVAVAALVARALAKDPADRHPDAAALAEAARAAASGEFIPTAGSTAADWTADGMPTAWSPAAGLAAAGATGRVTVGAATGGQGPHTLTDLPAVPSIVGRPPRHRAAAAAGVAVALVFAVAGLAAALNLADGDADRPPDGTTPGTQLTSPSAAPSGEDEEDDPDQPVRPSTRPTDRAQSPTPGSAPTSAPVEPDPEPSGEPEPTSQPEVEPTPPPVPTPTAEAPGDGDPES